MPKTTSQALAVITSIDSVPHILKLVAETTGIGFICIAHVTKESWTACAVYDEINFQLKSGDNLEVTSTLCNNVRAMQAEIVIEHASEDPVYHNNPVPKQYGFESYFSVPLYHADGSFFGTLCGLDKKPVKLKTDRLNSMIGSFASLLTRQISTAAQYREVQTELNDQREAVTLREQNIAILGHDLRTPLSSITMGFDVIEQITREPQVKDIVRMMRSSALRIKRLISDVMDFAHTRVGQGLIIKRTESDKLEKMLVHTASELKSGYPAAEIFDDIQIREIIYCDAERLCQLFSNLLINALLHGDLTKPVTTRAWVEESVLHLEVINYGETIDSDALDSLFQPFWRLDTEKTGEGLGLGLFIASEISKAHDAELTVKSENNRTCFTLTMPVKPAR